MKHLLSLIVALISVSAFGQTTSDELPPVSCGNRLVTALRCSGRYCDNITLSCGGPAHQIYDVKWTAFISEEGGAEASCDLVAPFFGKADKALGFVTGVKCRGSYCDDVSLQCVSLRDARANETRCQWTRWISEETGPIVFAPGTGATKMQCRGRYCDDMRFWVCPVRKP